MRIETVSSQIRSTEELTMTLRQQLRVSLQDSEYRHAYADEQLNLSIGTQIKVLREQQEMTQEQLAAKIGTKQAGISRLESANYAGWSIAALRRVAQALDCSASGLI
jgi:ribosome-binding protein aMBF1 (putative translation factor)